ncbi:glycoside hydrolase family 2 TIM barrel-domain containing protein [Kamptonema cortianum]|nr:glycoside hydrolase family 2 TIM barrel-domain containing protein [Geitlerinema splendidum]MDK3156107.1 glycoside hydrolase family 2 TIM barrel-domain containing protein [Kamptonema cortianum]
MVVMTDTALDTTVRLKTRWSEDAIAGRAWQEYPRPQLVRDEWQCLNGIWEFALTPADQKEPPTEWRQIRVPYPVESDLSGVSQRVGKDQAAWYRRTIEVSEAWGSAVLHFGAVDWDATVWVNGRNVGEHRGGYTPFEFDGALKAGENEIVVRVWDPTDAGYQPRGKQVENPSGIWYTPVTGIWQTVWMEPRPNSHYTSVWAETQKSGQVTLNVVGNWGEAEHRITVFDAGDVVAETQGKGDRIEFKLNQPKLWSPDSPHLYDVEIELLEKGEVADKVRSYFAVREVSIVKDAYGPRFYLNGKPVFMYGPLDQGWWPDGLYTPPSDEAMRYDLEMTKRMGFNTVRKHVKVEPARWYRHCDELGLIVWQDMPNGDRSPAWDINYNRINQNPDRPRSKESADNYRRELKEMIDFLRFSPSIVMWVPFNEAWGQFDTDEIAGWVKSYDPHRIVNAASGGNFTPGGDVLDIHVYPGPGTPGRQDRKLAILGEFGGLGLVEKGHLWLEDGNWGYRNLETRTVLADRYRELIESLYLMKSSGLSGAIYTQTTDVEIEVNGLMTYDRAITKIPADHLYRWNRMLYGEPVILEEYLPAAETARIDWRFVEVEPREGWEQPDYDDSAWRTGKAGFGTPGTPGAVIGTEWRGTEIWLRTRFEVSQPPRQAWLRIHHDEDAQVYLNGKLVADLKGYTTSYTYIGIDAGILRRGVNTLAIRCKQTTGGQYIDAGISGKG